MTDTFRIASLKRYLTDITREKKFDQWKKWMNINPGHGRKFQIIFLSIPYSSNSYVNFIGVFPTRAGCFKERIYLCLWQDLGCWWRRAALVQLHLLRHCRRDTCHSSFFSGTRTVLSLQLSTCATSSETMQSTHLQHFPV